MPVNIQFVKSHWKLLGGSFVGILLLYYLVRHGSAGSAAAATPDLSGGGNVNQNLQAAASLQNAQTDASTTIAAYQASAMNNTTAANLQASLADTAAKAAVAQGTTAATLALGLDQDKTKLSIQQVQSEQAVKTTAIQGQTISNLAITSAQTQIGVANAKASINLAQISLQKDIFNTLALKGKLGGNSEGVAKIVSSVYGQGPEAIAASQPSAVANSAGAILSGVGSIATALFR